VKEDNVEGEMREEWVRERIPFVILIRGDETVGTEREMKQLERERESVEREGEERIRGLEKEDVERRMLREMSMRE
jgi:hypothetical protein